MISTLTLTPSVRLPTAWFQKSKRRRSKSMPGNPPTYALTGCGGALHWYPHYVSIKISSTFSVLYSGYCRQLLLGLFFFFFLSAQRRLYHNELYHNFTLLIYCLAFTGAIHATRNSPQQPVAPPINITCSAAASSGFWDVSHVVCHYKSRGDRSAVCNILSSLAMLVYVSFIRQMNLPWKQLMKMISVFSVQLSPYAL